MLWSLLPDQRIQESLYKADSGSKLIKFFVQDEDEDSESDHEDEDEEDVEIGNTFDQDDNNQN